MYLYGGYFVELAYCPEVDKINNKKQILMCIFITPFFLGLCSVHWSVSNCF